MRRKATATTTFAILLGLGAGLHAFAHNYLPAVQGQAVTIIPDISVSRAAYRELRGAGAVDIYEFSAKQGQEIFIEMTVPVLDRQKGFAPSFMLVSMGEGAINFTPPEILNGVAVDPPHEVVDQVHPHEGADSDEPQMIGVSYDGKPDTVFDEPVTGTRYWVRQSLTVRAPADGTYRIGVYAPNGESGKYVLAPGKAERFSLADIFSLPAVRHAVRQFCELPVWGDVLVDVLIFAGVSAAVIAAIAGGGH